MIKPPPNWKKENFLLNSKKDNDFMEGLIERLQKINLKGKEKDVGPSAPNVPNVIMNEIFNPYMDFLIVYIDDILIYSENIDQHFKHLNIFIQTAKKSGLAINAKKVKIFQTRIKFLGHYIENGIIIPIERVILFADKFPDKIIDLNQLQRFLGSLNYIGDFYKDLAQDCKLLFQRLRKNPLPSAKDILLKDVKTVASKQIFARRCVYVKGLNQK